MASHEELVAELQKLEKLSHAARLKHAKKRRVKQLKKYQEWVRYDRQTSATFARKRVPAKVNFEDGALLNDLVSRNDLIGVSKLLEKGADPNISNADGLTLLHKCCIDNSLEMAEVILEHGVDLNARDIEGWTALHAAAATGNIQMINLLIDEGASLVAINNDDKMPLDVAADSDIRYVLQQKMVEAGYTEDVLEYIRVSVPKTMLADLKDSVRNNRSLNIQDKYGSSALHIAASNGYTEVMNFLLATGEVDLDIADNEGWTPFHAAVCWNQPEMMKQLAEKGADMDLKNSRGETPYVIAEEPEIRQLILELKGQYSEQQELDLEDLQMEGGERQPRARRMSVKRISQQAKNELAKQSAQDEASLRRESMAQHDLQMSITGKLDDKAMSDVVAGAGMDEDEETATLIRLKSISVATEALKVSPEPPAASAAADQPHSDPLQRIAEDGAEEAAHHSALEKRESNLSVVEMAIKARENSSNSNDRSRKTDTTRPSRISLQEEPFNKARQPRKSVLKRVNHIPKRTSSTYDSTTSSPPTSPSTVSTGSVNNNSNKVDDNSNSSGSVGGVVSRPPMQQGPGKRECCVVM